MHQLLFWCSLVALNSANLTDIKSSWHQQELNPVVGRGSFGAGQLSFKLAVVGGSTAIQAFRHRKHHEHDTALTVGNFTGAGILTAASIHNIH